MDSEGEGEGEGGMISENGTETCIRSCKKRIASLCLMQDAWAWCMRMIQRDDMEWEVGGGFRIGNSCTPVADSCQCMAKQLSSYITWLYGLTFIDGVLYVHSFLAQ